MERAPEGISVVVQAGDTIPSERIKEFVYSFASQTEEKPLVPAIKWSQTIYLLPELVRGGHTTP